MSFIFTSLQRWIAARDQYNNGHGLLPADRAPVGIPYRDLLRPSDEGGLPNRMPISGSFSAALFFLRRMLEAIHRMFSFNAVGPEGGRTGWIMNAHQFYAFCLQRAGKTMSMTRMAAMEMAVVFTASNSSTEEVTA